MRPVQGRAGFLGQLLDPAADDVDVQLLAERMEGDPQPEAA
jgi:hypothetical protein